MSSAKIDRAEQDAAQGVTWYSQSWHELYWSEAQREPRRLHLSRFNAEGEALNFGKTGEWGFAWHDIDGQGYATADEARAAAMTAAPAHWGTLTPMEA